MYRVTINVLDRENESHAATFENPYEAVNHLHDELKELEGSYRERCEEHCRCHNSCDWCDSADKVEAARSAICDGSTAARLSNGRSRSWTFTPPEGPVVSCSIG